MGTQAVISHNDKLGAGARLLTDLFCWFPWVSSSGFGSLKLGTSEYTMQNLQRQRQHPCFNTTFKYQFRRSRLLLNYLTTCFHNGIKLCIDVLQPRLKQTACCLRRNYIWDKKITRVKIDVWSATHSPIFCRSPPLPVYRVRQPFHMDA